MDRKLTELALYAKELCPEAEVEISTVPCEYEDGHLDVFPPPSLSEAEEERIELAVMERAGFDEVKRLDEVFFQPVLVGTKTDALPSWLAVGHTCRPLSFAWFRERRKKEVENE